MEEKIAECAKRIWVLLEQAQEVNILRLSELLEERNVVAYQALGWLARDKKIRYAQKGSQVFISRHEGEASAPPDRRSSRRNT
ncbi:MAG: winged helix-turn-helix domain-containing protein [Spirochaetia bacterium]